MNRNTRMILLRGGGYNDGGSRNEYGGNESRRRMTRENGDYTGDYWGNYRENRRNEYSSTGEENRRWHEEDLERERMRRGGRRMALEDEQNRGGMKQGWAQVAGNYHEGEKLTRHQAEKWVDSMKHAAGGQGEKFDMKQAERYAKEMGMPEDDEEAMIEFYAAMNAMYADYCEVAREFEVDEPRFFAKLAMAFLCDEDAQDDKLMRYMKCVAEK